MRRPSASKCASWSARPRSELRLRSRKIASAFNLQSAIGNPRSAMNAKVDFLGILFVVWGLLTTLVGLSTLALGAAAVALFASADGGSRFAAGVTAAVFT